MILGEVKVPGKSLECEVCHYRWVSIASDLPESCRNRECRSREWNGPKKRVRPTRIELPKPKRTWGEEDEETYF